MTRASTHWPPAIAGMMPISSPPLTGGSRALQVADVFAIDEDVDEPPDLAVRFADPVPQAGKAGCSRSSSTSATDSPTASHLSTRRRCRGAVESE